MEVRLWEIFDTAVLDVLYLIYYFSLWLDCTLVSCTSANFGSLICYAGCGSSGDKFPLSGGSLSATEVFFSFPFLAGFYPGVLHNSTYFLIFSC